ncbi:methyltransferase domain-containing protein [Paenibacillus sp.]|uniref:methyltransferase domain-containing protein n=1 Tax=Paenibacillus sp. TaxID=58172 RepID=UPI002D3A8065|nr:methyltransferase domain-containing protein [Paenibacillus sp.]HZG84652.1 methyltransferase domain-containing protein [Paenibacillus sp.]
MNRSYYLRTFLNHFWLRPENAILLSLRAESYWKTIQAAGADGTKIDVSCGDGVFSFLTFGGQTSPDSDMFRAIKFGKREGEFDAFDFFDDTYKIKVEKSPEIRYEYGADWKSSLIQKAEKLNFYDNTLVHDNNLPLPFADESMDYVYSNSSYWVENFENHIKDLVRITKQGGYVVLQIKNDNIKKLSSKVYAPMMGETFHKIIDAGRASTWKGLRSKDELVRFISSIDDAKLETIEPIYGDILAVVWDIGLRPLFNPLVKMANNLSDGQRIEIKNEWNEIFFQLFEEVINKYRVVEEQAIEHTFVLRKL